MMSTITITKGMPFPDSVNQSLLSLYTKGMTGWGEKYEPFLTTARDTTGLTLEQIKGWIRRRNRKRRHAEGGAEDVIVKRPCHSTWHQFMKDYGKTEEGKHAMAEHPGKFNKLASERYRELAPDEKEELKAKETEIFVKMDGRGVLREAEKLFQKIQKLFDALDGIGFKGFAVCYHKEYAQVIGTSGTVESFTPAVHEYFHALVTVAHPPPLPAPALTSLPSTTTNASTLCKPTRSATSKMFSMSNNDDPLKPSLPLKPSVDHPPPLLSPALTSPPCSSATTTNASKLCKPTGSATSKMFSVSNNDHQLKPSIPLKPSVNHPPPLLSQALTSPHSSSATTTNASELTNHSLPSQSVEDQPFSNGSSDMQKPLPCSGHLATDQPSSSSSSLVQPIVVSSSPVKEDVNVWIPSLNLSKNDRAILQSEQWLNDGIMNAVQSLLCDQTQGSVLGWQNTQLGKHNAFKPLPQKSKFVQILHVADSHWVVVSNIRERNAVGYYDSLRPLSISPRVRKTICSFFKCVSSTLHFDIVDVMRQPNSHDCGVYAAAIATELVNHSDPALCNWDTSKMRQHLLNCLQAGSLSQFPTKGKRRLGLGARIRKTITEKVYCECRMPNDKSQPMISCDNCNQWFHKNCVNLDTDKSYENETWNCRACMSLLSQLKS